MPIKISQLFSLTSVYGNTALPVVANVGGTLTTLQTNLDYIKPFFVSTTEANITLANTIQTASILAANTGLKGYVDRGNTIQSDQINSLSSALVQANVGMKGYADAITTAWQANALSQQTAIYNLQISQANSQSNTSVLTNFIQTQTANITSTADATSTTTGALRVAGGVGVGGNVVAGGNVVVAQQLIINSINNSTAIVNSGTSGVGNIGSSSKTFNTVFAKATTAQYADLAERYQADNEYEPGTVLMFGGVHEVTIAVKETPAIAGVVSANPAYQMNDKLDGVNTVAVALVGRVPCKVSGPVQKGEMMISAGEGYACAAKTPILGQVIGKALESFDGDKGVIEIVVGRL